MKNYVKRVWLNKTTSSFTGSIVAFYGKVIWDNKSTIEASLEIADCRSKVRIHKYEGDSIKEFINKLRKMEVESS